ncbi:MAG: GxxExxY protein [Burkholderiales bacterium]
MDVDEQRQRINQITEKIINCAYRVGNTLGSGFLERVYENALTVELRQNELQVEQQHPIRVFYNEVLVGDFNADLLVENCVVVELKTARALDEAHSAQCMNYLKATGLKVCLLINFGKPRVDVKRIVLDF